MIFVLSAIAIEQSATKRLATIQLGNPNQQPHYLSNHETTAQASPVKRPRTSVDGRTMTDYEPGFESPATGRPILDRHAETIRSVRRRI